MEGTGVILIGAGAFALYLCARLAAALCLPDGHWINAQVFGLLDSDDDGDCGDDGGD